MRPRPSRFYFLDTGRDESEMIEDLCVCITMTTSMKREVVASRREVSVVGVGLPHHAHAEDARVELRGALNIGNPEREMSKSAMLYHVGFQSARR